MKPPQLILRDLFWLVLMVALGMGWVVENQKRAAERREHTRKLSELNGMLATTRAKLEEAEELLEFEGVVFGDGTTTHTMPDEAHRIREQRRAHALR